MHACRVAVGVIMNGGRVRGGGMGHAYILACLSAWATLSSNHTDMTRLPCMT